MMRHRSIAVVAAVALALVSAGAARAKTLRFTAGWDNFSEPLTYASSSVVYNIDATTHVMATTVTLHGATPTKLYEVAIIFFDQCPTPPKQFGRFDDFADFTCAAYTRQNVTASTSSVDFGAILTDASGTGSVTVSLGKVAAGSHAVEFVVRDGVGCEVSGGAGSAACAIDFQTPGPTFGDTATITVP